MGFSVGSLEIETLLSRCSPRSNFSLDLCFHFPIDVSQMVILMGNPFFFSGPVATLFSRTHRDEVGKHNSNNSG